MTVRETFREMEELRREIDRVFQGFEGGTRPSFRRLAFLPGLAHLSEFHPAVRGRMRKRRRMEKKGEQMRMMLLTRVLA